MQKKSDTKEATENTARQRPGGEVRRHDLVVAAYQLITERGFEGLRVRDVAERAGVNIATLHYYFETKEALVHGVVDYLLQQFLTITAPVPEGERASAAQLLRQNFLNLQYQLQVMPDMFVVLTELHLRAQRDPSIAAPLQALHEGWHTYLQGVCQEGIDHKEFRADLDPAQATSLVIALIKGLSLQAVSKLDTFDYARIGTEIERWFRTAEDTVAHNS